MYNRYMDLFIVLIVVGILLFSLTIHEIAHGLMAFWLGDDTAKNEGRLTFNPVEHLEPFMSVILPTLCILTGTPVIGGAKPVPVNPRKLKGEEWGMALVALAGPLSNFIMAFIAFAFFSVLNMGEGFAAIVAVYFIKINLGLMLFNLLPVPPLDGSKIIYPIAPEFIQKGIRSLERNPLVIFAIILLFSTQISGLIGIAQSAILSFFYWIF